jgi:hypothetical protein
MRKTAFFEISVLLIVEQLKKAQTTYSTKRKVKKINGTFAASTNGHDMKLALDHGKWLFKQFNSVLFNRSLTSFI